MAAGLRSETPTPVACLASQATDARCAVFKRPIVDLWEGGGPATALVNAPLPLVGELNHYYDADKCYIGFHGDKERKIVVGVRSGPGADGFPLKFQWYRNHKPVGDTGYLTLNRGDIYLMSEKAVGTDWHETKDGLLTLRHAAGKKSVLKKRKRDDKNPKSVRLCPRD